MNPDARPTPSLSTVKKLFPGVFMLEGEVGGRPLQLTYLKGNLASLLFDTGCTNDPQKFIAPQIKEAGGDPSKLTWIVNSHPDADHTGGNHEMKKIAPNARLACGDADRALCEHPETLFKKRYDAHRENHDLFYEGDTLKWLKDESGMQPQPIEVTFRGGEHIRIGDDWEIEILSTPGHAHGHLTIFDPKHEAAYGADSLHGSVYLSLKGEPVFCPTYAQVDDYLNTIQLTEHLPITTYLGCHWPLKKGSQIAEFCTESRAYAEKAERLMLSSLKKPHTLKELCIALGPKLGDWPRAVDLDLAYAFNGHLVRLLARNIIQGRVRHEKPRILEFEMA